jgi:hypothetical protein
MDTVFAVIDAQAFYINKEFMPRELAIAPIERDIIQSWEVRMPVKYNSLAEEDKKVNDFIMEYTGLPFDLEVTDESSHLAIDKVKLMLVLLHNKYSCDCKPNFGIRNYQLGHYLASIGLPFVEIQCNSIYTLGKLYKRKFCERHVFKSDGMCAVNKVNILKNWILDNKNISI